MASLAKFIRMLPFAFFSIVVLFCTGTPKLASSMAIPTETSTPNIVTSQQDRPTIDCGPMATTSYTPSTNACAYVGTLQRYTRALMRQQKKFWDKFSNRSGVPPEHDNPILEINDLPDTTVLRSKDICDLDLLTTHFFILDGFKKAMDAVIIDEEQYNGSQHLTREFTNTTQLLVQVMEGTRALVCSSGQQGQSRIPKVENFNFPAYSSQSGSIYITWRDHTVLYWLRVYTQRFHLDVRKLMPARRPSIFSNNCGKTLQKSYCLTAF